MRAQNRRPSRAEEVSRLAALPWTVELRRNRDGSFFARVVELPGCMTEGDDERHALANLRDSLELWLDSELERGAPIPEPAAGRRYSGIFTVRTSPLVHRLATETAGRLGVSLNELASEALALAAGAGAWEVPARRRSLHERNGTQGAKKRAASRAKSPGTSGSNRAAGRIRSGPARSRLA